jgi:hypothetical protein
MNRLWFLLALLFVGCANTPQGQQIDDWCIAGKLRGESVAFLNENPDTWKRHSDYTAPIRKDDRILSVHCSEFLRALADGDFEQADKLRKKMKKNDD